MEWQVRDAKQLCRRKRTFGRGLYFYNCHLQQGSRRPSPEHIHRPTKAKIRPTFRLRSGGGVWKVTQWTTRWMLLVFPPLFRVCLSSSSPGSYHSLLMTSACKFIMPVPHSFSLLFFSSRQCLFPKHSHPAWRQFCLYFLMAHLWESKSLERAARLSILPGTGRGIQLCVSNMFSPRCGGE